MPTRRQFPKSPLRDFGEANVRFGMHTSCPLYPQKRTLLTVIGMSALCQKRTFE
jgi:hypothetical protein